MVLLGSKNKKTIVKINLFLIFTIVFFSNIKSYSQFNSINEILKYDKTYPLTEVIVDSIINNHNYGGLHKKAISLSHFGIFFNLKGRLNSAITYSKKSLNIFRKNNLKSKEYHNALYLLGVFYLYNNEIDTAIKYLKKASNLNIYPKKKGQALCQLGNCYQDLGNFKKSIDFYEKGIDLLKNYGKRNSIITNCINLASSCNFIKDQKKIKKGIKYLNYADSLYEKNKNNLRKDLKHNLINSLANLFGRLGNENTDKSLKYYQKNIKSLRKTKDLYLYLTYTNYGETLLNNNKDSAKYYLDLAIKENPNSSYNDKIIKASTYRNLGYLHLKSQELHNGLSYINKSLNLSFGTKNTTPNKTQLIKTNRRFNVLKTLNIKIKILKQLYFKNKNSKFLNQIIETVNISDQLVEIILEDSTESSTQFSWRNDVSKIYNYGIYAARVLGDDDLQFQYLEKNKAFLLTQSINDNNYSLNLPNHIVNKELHYKKQILEFESKISESKQLRDSLFDIKFNYQNFKDSIQLAYPKHFESKQKVQLTSLDKVQKTINDNTIIISYALQDEEIIDNISSGLLISKNKTIPFAISNIHTLQKNLNLYRQLIAKPLNTKEEINKFNKVSHYLYQNLFPTKEIQELIKGKQLTIIPDNQLQNIPFEAFITDISSNSYLIEDNDISYAYSMSFSDINNNIERTQTKEFAAFAPINFENQKLTSLEYSEKEINTISDNLNGLSLTGNSVTKDSFFKNAADARIIHLATHADISKKPVIHFSKDSLNLHELYTYKNNADLVVLSACETNLGELKKGEGILNLARGFFYSGSKSVVSSLWKVNDVATTSLMTDFYANLKDHQSKSEALNNAKRDYLKTHTLSEKSPYYWASFILIGDTAPTFESDYTIYWIIGSLLFGVLLFFLGVKTLKKKEK
ncbi:CHAT domain-containing protein [uncultured Tenacibaculum sp.]|uniref:CHAT domain-containing protein n=1 Tax=uncultured Tenacibaculum sp. TaxID=174713 RepID=UPI00260BDBDA|nr:CHAT domain-containing protein [uncultured Tenacibaculum sp.]